MSFLLSLDQGLGCFLPIHLSEAILAGMEASGVERERAHELFMLHFHPAS
jgi:hypothetical protein